MALGGLAIGAAALTTNDAEAHFRLEAPAVMTEQNDLGDPQKAYPCGDNGSAVFTGDVTAYTAGETITITIDETIYHPGHYRVSLAPNDPSELPPDPAVTPSPTDACAMTEIMNPPVYPVLADGMLPHASPFEGEQSFEVTLPADVSCDNCTLQVVQYMSSHAAPCFYYHCANISISPAEGTTGEPGTTTGDPSGETGSTSGTPDPTGDPTETSAGNADTGETPDPTAASGDTAASGGSGGAGTGTDGMGQDSAGGGGGCSTHGHGGTAGLLALLPLLFASRRRRR